MVLLSLRDNQRRVRGERLYRDAVPPVVGRHLALDQMD